ncbi:MAG: hypothetical protein K6E30_09360 [Lachnospiraceae bacterium]|nr:hypothetical protein [Lachnospiraceae bacterium]
MGNFVRYDILADAKEPKVTMMETFDAHVNRNSKDSIFCDLFSRPEYCLQLYLGDTYNRYITKENLNIYGIKDVKLPIPELYVIYHGDREDKPDEITLSRDIFGINDPKNIFVDVKAKIIYDSTPGDIIDQFITFARVFDQQVQEHGRNRKAVEETLRICRNQDVLKDYLKDEEAATIMFTLLDEQKARKFWEEEIRQEGRTEGRAEGRIEGEAKLGSLMTQLKKLGRTDDAFRAASNETYRNQLYRELNIQ